MVKKRRKDHGSKNGNTLKEEKEDEVVGWGSWGSWAGYDFGGLSTCGYSHDMSSWGMTDEQIEEYKKRVKDCEENNPSSGNHKTNCYPDFREDPNYIPGDTVDDYEFEMKGNEKVCNVRKKDSKDVAFNENAYFEHKNGIPVPTSWHGDTNCMLQGVNAKDKYGKGVHNVVSNYCHLHDYMPGHLETCSFDDRFLLHCHRKWFLTSNRILVNEGGTYAGPCDCVNVHSRCKDRDCKIDDVVMWTYCNCNTGQKMAFKKVLWSKAGNGKECMIGNKVIEGLKTGDIVPVNPSTGKVETENGGYKKFHHVCFPKEMEACNMHNFCTQDQYNFNNEPLCREMIKEGYDETKLKSFNVNMKGPRMSDKNSFSKWKSDAIRSFCDSLKVGSKHITKTTQKENGEPILECECLNQTSDDPDMKQIIQLNNLPSYGGNRCVPEFTNVCESTYVQRYMKNNETVNVKKNLYPSDKKEKHCWTTLECGDGVNFENSTLGASDEASIEVYASNTCVDASTSVSSNQTNDSNPFSSLEGRPSYIQDPSDSELLAADNVEDCRRKTINNPDAKKRKAFVFRNEGFGKRPNTCYAISTEKMNGSLFKKIRSYFEEEYQVF